MEVAIRDYEEDGDDGGGDRHEVQAVLKQRGRADREVVVSVPVGVLEGDEEEQV